MKQNFKRFLSLALAIVMVFSLFTGNIAYAADEGSTEGDPVAPSDPPATESETPGDGNNSEELPGSDTPTSEDPNQEQANDLPAPNSDDPIGDTPVPDSNANVGDPSDLSANPLPNETDLAAITDGADPTAADPVAKVGNTEYVTIVEAINNWTAGSTLTLLADVTLSNVITIKSTEHHILNLGTFTMTAAPGMNAIEIIASGTGDSERSALTVQADAANPGGINAGNKSVIYYDYSKGTTIGNDRPIIRIEGGVLTGSTSSYGSGGIYAKGTAARKCATLNFSGGTFNCTVLGTGKSKLLISGGTFNYSVGSQGDSTCYRLISGGTFKTLGFMTADNNNTKFWIGTSMANSNVGVYIDDNGYLVVGGPVITEAGETFEASSTNYGGWSSYLKYSSAATNDLYYTSVEEALADNNKATNVVTIYTDELDLTSLSYMGTLNLPEDGELTVTFKEGTNPTWKVASTVEGQTVTYTDTVANGVVTRTYKTITPVAQIGEEYFETLQEAAKKIATDGTDTTIELLSDIELDESIEFAYGTGKVTFTAQKPVTIKQTKVGLDFAFTQANAANIVIGENVTLEVYDNSSGVYAYYGPCFTIDGAITGGQNWGVLYLFNGEHTVSETGRIGTGRTQIGLAELTVQGKVDTNYLFVEGSTFTADGASVDAGVIYDNNNGSQRWGASKFEIKNGSTVTTDKFALSYAESELKIDATSTLTAKSIIGNGKIIVDATGMEAGPLKTIKADVSNFAGTINVINNDNLVVKIDEAGNIVLVRVDSYAAKIGEKYYNTLQDAVNAAEAGATITLIKDFDLSESVKVEKEVTLDLNGRTITGTDNNTSGNFYLINNNKGNLTIKDSVGNGAITLKATNERNWSSSSVVVANQQGTLTIEGGTIKHLGGTSMAYAIDNLTNSGIGAASLTVTGGTIDSSYFAIRQFANCYQKLNSVTIKNGDIGYVWMQSPNSNVNLASTTVTGGSVDGICVSGVNANYTLSASGACLGESKIYGTMPAGKAAEVQNGIWTLVDAVAKAGDTAYASLAAATAAAQDGETVTLLKDIALDWDDVVMTADNLPVLVPVDGKSITLDMNGKKISVHHQSTTDRIYAVVFVADGASLTVTGDGSIDVDVDDNSPKVAYLFWKRGTTGSLTIKNGSYHMDNSEDSMVYTNGNEIVTVEGGTFTLDKVGTRNNGFPCIFNATGKNERSIVVSGGTYNSNISQQYWAHEVNIADAEGKLMAVEDNGNGTWSVVEAAAYITKKVGGYDYKVGYATLADAVASVDKGQTAAATTITLTGDLNLPGRQYVGKSYAQNIIIDLNGSTLTCNDNALTAYRSGTTLTVQNGIVRGMGDTLVATYNGTLVLGDNLTVACGGGRGDAIRVDNGTLIVDKSVTGLRIMGTKSDIEAANSYNITIGTGTFNFEVPEEYCIENYGSVKNSDGTWTVKQVKFVLNETTGETYNTFAEAISAIAKGAGEQNLKLLGNVTVKGQFIGHSYAQKATVDLNGFTMSSTDKALTVYRSGTIVTLKNGTVSGNSTGGTIQVTYGGKLVLGDDITVKAGGSATAIKLDNGTLITDGQNISVPTGKVSIVVAANNTSIALNAGTYKTEIKPEWCAEGYKPVQNEDSTYSVVVDPAYGMEAKIGEEYYETLTEAMNAAVNGDTVTLVNNIELGWDDAVKTADNLPILVAVEGKSITLDMNGKTICVDHQSTTDRIYAVVFVADGASLTVTGEGGIDVNVDDNNPKVAYLFWKRGTIGTLTIENGNFRMDNSEDSMVYTNGSDIVTVNGGTFILDMIATRSNGFPCIFNTQGNGERNIDVTGGTFNYDINHQYWTHEVDVPETKAVKANGDGTWTVVDAEAYITEMVSGYKHYVGYATLAEAMAAAKNGEIVTLVKDIVLEAPITVAAGKTVVLDLNGNTLSGTDTTEKNFGLIQNNGTLTIKDSGENGKITVNATVNSGWNRYSAVISNNPGGTLVVDGGTIEHLGGTDMAYGIDSLTNGGIGDVSVTINGGTIKSTYRAIRQFLNSDSKQNVLTINGGTVEGANNGVFFHDPSAKANNGTITIEDGAKVSGVYLYVTPGSTEWPVEVKIAASAITGEVKSANVPTGYVVDVVDGYYGVYRPNVKVTSSDGSKYFDTLAAAIAAAESGDTITLMCDVNVGKDDVVELDSYGTIFKVDGKTITIDLNGKTVSCDAAGMDKMLVGVFSAVNGANLTLTGNGTVEATANGANVYALVVNYNPGTSITIENGAYTLDAASDCLMYTTADEGLIINGGTFTLGNVGANGKTGNYGPWIFNASGRNERNVVVNGGTFNADVNHQYWVFEAQMPKEKALKANGDGTWTTVDAVAYVTEREWSSKWYTNEIGYATLEEAIAACEGPQTKIYYSKPYVSEQEEVVLLDDIVLNDTLVIPAGKTVVLDLNGKTIRQTKACTAHYEMIKNSGSLTIKDSAGTGKISFTDNGAGDPNFGWGSYTIGNYGTLVVENGTIENLTELNSAEQAVHMYCAIHQGWGAVSATINGGKISTPTYRSIRVNHGTLTINDGACDGQIWMHPFADGTSITINGGSFCPNGGDGSSVYVENGSRDVAVLVTGGYFATKFGCANADKLTGVITGGEFSESAKADTNPVLFANN